AGPHIDGVQASARAPVTEAVAEGAQDGAVSAGPRFDRRALAATVLAACAIVGTVAVQIVLLHREQYLLWLVPVLIGGCAVAAGAFAAVRALSRPAMAVAFSLLMVA